MANIIEDHLRGYLINDTLEDMDFYAIPVSDKDVSNFAAQLKEHDGIILKRIRIAKDKLLFLGKEATPNFAKLTMPERISKLAEDEKSFARKFFYTREPLNDNHIPPKGSNVQGHYGNIFIANTLVSTTGLQFEMLQRLLNTAHILVIKTKK